MLDAALAEEEGREYVPAIQPVAAVAIPQDVERPDQPTLTVGPQTLKVEDEKSFGGAATAMAATAAKEALPTAAAMAAFPYGMAGGAAVGGPAAPVTGIIGGLGASAVAYWAASKAQEEALEFVAPDSYAQFQSYLEKAGKDYPVSTFVGRTAVPMRSMMKFDAGNVKNALSFSRELLKGTAELNSTVGKLKLENFMNVAFGGGSEMAAEAMRQWQEDGRLDFALLGAATLVGAGMNKPTALGSKVLGMSPFKVKDQLPSEPVSNETDEELAQALMDELSGADLDFIPNPIREKYSSLEDFIKGDFSNTEMVGDKDVLDMLRLQAKTLQAEKTSDPATWSPQEREAYDSGNYEKFSKLRGYTESEIADFKNFNNFDRR